MVSTHLYTQSYPQVRSFPTPVHTILPTSEKFPHTCTHPSYPQLNGFHTSVHTIISTSEKFPHTCTHPSYPQLNGFHTPAHTIIPTSAVLVLPLQQLHSENRVCHVVKITIAESDPDLGLFTQQTFWFIPDVLAKDVQMPIMTLWVASDWRRIQLRKNSLHMTSLITGCDMFQCFRENATAVDEIEN